MGAVGTLTHLTSIGVAGTTNARAIEMAREDAQLALAVVLGDLPTGGGDDTGGGDTGSGDTGGGDTGGDDTGSEGKGNGKGKGGAGKGKGKPAA